MHVWSSRYHQQNVDLHDPQQFQNDEDDNDDEQDVNNITRPWNARVHIRAEIAKQP